MVIAPKILIPARYHASQQVDVIISPNEYACQGILGNTTRESNLEKVKRKEKRGKITPR